MFYQFFKIFGHVLRGEWREAADIILALIIVLLPAGVFGYFWGTNAGIVGLLVGFVLLWVVRRINGA